MINKKNIIIVLFLTLSTFLGSGFTFLTQILLAKNLSTADYGLFSANFAIVTLLAPIAIFGIPQFWLRFFGKYGWNGIKCVKPSLYLIIFTTIFTFFSIFMFTFLVEKDESSKQVLLILSFYILGQLSLELVSSKFQLEENYIKLSFWQFFPHFSRFIFILILIYIYRNEINVINVSIIYSSVAIFYFLIGIFEIKKIFTNNFKLKNHPERDFKNDLIVKIKNIVPKSWPFTLSTFFYLIYFQSDLIMVKYFIGNESAGLYNVAFTILVAILLFPNIIYQKFLMPKLHRWANHDKSSLMKFYKLGQKTMLISGLIIFLLTFLLSKHIILIIFGEKYFDSIILLNVLLLSVPIVFLAHNSGAILTTKNYINQKVKYMGVIALLNVILNLIFIPEYGAIGAACTTLFSNLILLTLYMRGVKSIMKKDMNGK